MLQEACLHCPHCLPTPLGPSQKVYSGREGLPLGKINLGLPWFLGRSPKQANRPQGTRYLGCRMSEVPPGPVSAPEPGCTWTGAGQALRLARPGVGQGFTLRLLFFHSSASSSPTPFFEAAINIDSGKSMCFRGPGSIAKLQGSGQSHPCVNSSIAKILAKKVLAT